MLNYIKRAIVITTGLVTDSLMLACAITTCKHSFRVRSATVSKCSGANADQIINIG